MFIMDNSSIGLFIILRPKLPERLMIQGDVKLIKRFSKTPLMQPLEEFFLPPTEIIHYVFLVNI